MIIRIFSYRVIWITEWMLIWVQSNSVHAAAAAAKSLQLCLTLRRPHRWQPTRPRHLRDSPVRTLGWVAISFSNAWEWKVKVKSLSHVWLFTTPWAATYQAPPSMGFSRQEYWKVGCHCLLRLHVYMYIYHQKGLNYIQRGKIEWVIGKHANCLH